MIAARRSRHVIEVDVGVVAGVAVFVLRDPSRHVVEFIRVLVRGERMFTAAAAATSSGRPRRRGVQV